MLKAYRPYPSSVPELVYVVSDALAAPCNVVAKHNVLVGQTWRTKHAGERPSLASIREAIASA